MGVPLWPFGPLCERSRRPLDAPLTRQTRCSIALYRMKGESAEIARFGALALAKAPCRKKTMWIMPVNGATSPTGYAAAPPRGPAPVVRTKGGDGVKI